MVEINNLSGIKIDKFFLKKIAAKIFKKRGNLSIALVKSAEIKKLNKKYRKKNKPTDVLAFGRNQKSKAKSQNYNSKIKNELELFEIVICLQVVKENAKKYKSTLKKELAKVLIHGILHIVGYDHEKNQKVAQKMREKEEYYLKSLKIKN